MYLTSESLTKMAAATVAALKSNDVPLNDSITKLAMDSELNPDQVKRMVETSNQLAYLSQLEDSDDRTFEFDVANYDNIMDGMLPTGMSKAASVNTGMSPLEIVSSTFADPMEKVATDKEATIEKWGKNQKLLALRKLASHERNRLDEILSTEDDNLVKLANDRAAILRDPDALLKMAKFDNGAHMAQVVFGHDKVASEVRRVWSVEDMQDVQALSDRLEMCKQAREVKVELTDKVEKAEEILKQAFLSAAINVGKSIARNKSNVTRGSAQASPKLSKVKKAYGAFDVLDSTNDVHKGIRKNHDSWSSLRG